MTWYQFEVSRIHALIPTMPGAKEQLFGGRMKPEDLKGSGYAAAEPLGKTCNVKL